MTKMEAGTHDQKGVVLGVLRAVSLCFLVLRVGWVKRKVRIAFVERFNKRRRYSMNLSETWMDFTFGFRNGNCATTSFHVSSLFESNSYGDKVNAPEAEPYLFT